MKKIIKLAVLASAILTSTGALATYGDDAADAYLATMPALKQHPEVKQTEEYQTGLATLAQMFDNMYAQGLARKGTGFVMNEQVTRQNVLNHLQKTGAAGGAKETMQLVDQLVVAFRDGLQGKDFTDTTGTKAETLTCDIARRLPAPNADSAPGAIAETIKGGGTISMIGKKIAVAFPWDTDDEKTTEPVKRMLDTSKGGAFYGEDSSLRKDAALNGYVFNEISHHHSDYIFTNCK